MKDAIPLIIIMIAATIFMFLGMTTIFKRSIQSTPKVERTKEDQRRLTDQRNRQKEIQERQRELMRQQQQRLRDAQRNR